MTLNSKLIKLHVQQLKVIQFGLCIKMTENFHNPNLEV